ncbi:hypothetical protein OEZ86_002214 [Tetradesmus obliquus]|nr:hypothetical protein OEZ86_002214 [Tetradesmus obliquus]
MLRASSGSKANQNHSSTSSSFVPACRAQHLLDDAADAAATDFAAQRMQRLLAHCLAGWTAAVLVRGSARAAACQLLERVWAGQLLADWRLAAQLSRPAKAQLLAAWRDAAAEQRAGRLAGAAADGLARQHLLSRAWRSWVVAWCRSASARVFAKQLQAKRQAAVLAVLADNVHSRTRKRSQLAAAQAFRRNRLLPLCMRWWRSWAVYQRLLRQAGDAVQQAARARVLCEVFIAWRDLAGFRAWERGALEAAEGFYWSRLVAAQFYCWRSFAAQQQQQRQAGAAAAAAHGASLLTRAWAGWRQQALLAGSLRARLAARQQQLQQQVLHSWWQETVGSKRAFEFQVSRLQLSNGRKVAAAR